MTHDDHTARELVEEPLEPCEARKVEVVRGLIEEKHVEAADENRGERRARCLSTRQRRCRRVQQRFGETQVGARRAGPRFEVGAAGREIVVERACVFVVGVGRLRGERGGGPLELRAGRVHAGAATEELEQRLALGALGLLRQVAHAGARRGARHAAAVGSIEPREEPQQRRLADAIRSDDTQAGAGADGDVDAVEHGQAAASARGHGQRVRKRKKETCGDPGSDGKKWRGSARYTPRAYPRRDGSRRGFARRAAPHGGNPA